MDLIDGPRWDDTEIPAVQLRDSKIPAQAELEWGTPREWKSQLLCSLNPKIYCKVTNPLSKHGSAFPELHFHSKFLWYSPLFFAFHPYDFVFTSRILLTSTG